MIKKLSNKKLAHYMRNNSNVSKHKSRSIRVARTRKNVSRRTRKFLHRGGGETVKVPGETGEPVKVPVETGEPVKVPVVGPMKVVTPFVEQRTKHNSAGRTFKQVLPAGPLKPPQVSLTTSSVMGESKISGLPGPGPVEPVKVPFDIQRSNHNANDASNKFKPVLPAGPLAPQIYIQDDNKFGFPGNTMYRPPKQNIINLTKALATHNKNKKTEFNYIKQFQQLPKVNLFPHTGVGDIKQSKRKLTQLNKNAQNALIKSLEQNALKNSENKSKEALYNFHTNALTSAQDKVNILNANKNALNNIINIYGANTTEDTKNELTEVNKDINQQTKEMLARQQIIKKLKPSKLHTLFINLDRKIRKSKYKTSNTQKSINTQRNQESAKRERTNSYIESIATYNEEEKRNQLIREALDAIPTRTTPPTDEEILAARKAQDDQYTRIPGPLNQYLTRASVQRGLTSTA